MQNRKKDQQQQLTMIIIVMGTTYLVTMVFVMVILVVIEIKIMIVSPTRLYTNGECGECHNNPVVGCPYILDILWCVVMM